MAEIIAYIDEAGDEGFGKLKGTLGPGGQSQWLIIGACLVTAENDKLLPSWRNDIAANFPKRKSRDLHFRDLNHDQKVVVCKELAQRPIGAALTLSHKVTIPGSRWENLFRTKQYLYNYLVRWLLERIIADVVAASSPGEKCSVRLVFSRRGGTDYHVMATYLRKLMDGDEMFPIARTTRWDILDIAGISVEAHSKWAGLQLADCITSAFGAALEPNAYGNYEPRYAQLLRSRLIDDGNGVCLNRGFTIVPGMHACSPNAEQRAFLDSLRKKGG
jgi:hypothetical protein